MILSSKSARTPPQALILDQDSPHTRELATVLKAAGFEVSVGATSTVKSNDGAHGVVPDIAFVSLDLPAAFVSEVTSGDAFGEIREIILMGSRDESSMSCGSLADDVAYFFIKPFDRDFIPTLVADIYSEIGRAGAELETCQTCSMDRFGRLRGSSAPMRNLYRVLRKAAPTDASIMLVGESGTGKELVARTVHDLSKVADGPFVAINCAAIPRELFESELFGHERGSFSGANRRHLGYFERAANGTLFLDELTGMPLDLQIKLLRVLETGDYRRVGGETELQSNVRIIAATNMEPMEAIAEDRLREDLYYRIARFPISLPPLRNRSGDIAGLANHFLLELNRRNRTAISLSEMALKRIDQYHWPGNVRELRSVIERAYILAQTEIGPEHVPIFAEDSPGSRLNISVDESIEEVQRKLIYAALEANGGDKRVTAESLGVSLKTLYNRLNEYSSICSGNRESA